MYCRDDSMTCVGDRRALFLSDEDLVVLVCIPAVREDRVRRGLGRLRDLELIARQNAVGARLGRVLAAAFSWRAARTMQIPAGVGARLPILGVRVALGDLVARVRVHAIAAEQAPLEALLEGLVVGDGRFVDRRRHGAHEALVVAQSELWDSTVVRETHQATSITSPAL